MSTDMRVTPYSAEMGPTVLGTSNVQQARNVQDVSTGAHLPERRDQDAAEHEGPQESSPETLTKYVEQLEDLVPASVKRELQFSVDKDSGRMVVKVVDTKSGETIRQMPSEEVLRLQQALEKQSGFLLNVKA